MKTLPSLALVAVANFAYFSCGHAAVIVATNFDSTTPGNITANGTIPSADGLTATATADRYLIVANSGGDHSLQFVDNSATAGAPVASKTFTGASTDGTGDNLINGTFNLSLLSGTGSPDLRFMINSGSSLSGGSSASAVSLLISRTGDFSYLNGTTNTNPAFNLTPGTEYVFSINLDSSSTVQDTWRLQIAAAAAPSTNLFDSGWINTRAANILPNIVVWNGGVNAGNSSTTAFAQIDDLNFQLVPEPTSAILFVLGFLMLGAARKTRPSRI